MTLCAEACSGRGLHTGTPLLPLSMVGVPRKPNVCPARGLNSKVRLVAVSSRATVARACSAADRRAKTLFETLGRTQSAARPRTSACTARDLCGANNLRAWNRRRPSCERQVAASVHLWPGSSMRAEISTKFSRSALRCRSTGYHLGLPARAAVRKHSAGAGHMTWRPKPLTMGHSGIGLRSSSAATRALFDLRDRWRAKFT